MKRYTEFLLQKNSYITKVKPTAKPSWLNLNRHNTEPSRNFWFFKILHHSKTENINFGLRVIHVTR